MRSAAIFAAFVVVSAAGAAMAQTAEWRPDLIAMYESAGGQNIPNHLFDGPQGRRSAGGVCQMLTSTWLRTAPTIDIDVVKFPVAGAASEFDQWRACWKLWSVEGYRPWLCCNAKLRQVLAGHEGVPVARPEPKTTSEKRPDPIHDKVAADLERFAASSAVDLSGLKPSHRDDSPLPTMNIFSSD